MLDSAYGEASLAVPPDLWKQLQVVNRALWGVENAIRACEADGLSGAEFVALARQGYILNDQRRQLKRSINQVRTAR